MTWEEQLEEIVDHSQHVPTFQEWLTTTEYPSLSQLSPIGLRSLMITLYRRYRSEYGDLR